MKILPCVLLAALVFPLFSSPHQALAQTSMEIKACGVPKDVTVPLAGGYCDIYQRQLTYKEKAEALRKSLEERRTAYEQAHFTALENYRKNLEEIYSKDSKAYQESLSVLTKDQTGENVATEEVNDESKADAVPPQDDKTAENTAEESSQEEGGVKEREYPPEEGEDGQVVKKRVVMPEDAPDFDTKPF